MCGQEALSRQGVGTVGAGEDSAHGLIAPEQDRAEGVPLSDVQGLAPDEPPLSDGPAESQVITVGEAVLDWESDTPQESDIISDHEWSLMSKPLTLSITLRDVSAETIAIMWGSSYVLCDHHFTVMGLWRRHWKHESKKSFERRCETIARQCGDCFAVEEGYRSWVRSM